MPLNHQLQGIDKTVQPFFGIKCQYHGHQVDITLLCHDVMEQKSFLQR